MLPSYRCTTYIFGILFVIFSIVSLHLIFTLREQVPVLYSKYKVYLWAGSFSLTLPLLIRTILDSLYAADDAWTDWLNNDKHPKRSSNYLLIDFLFTTYIPIISQLASLIFGFIRKDIGKQ